MVSASAVVGNASASRAGGALRASGGCAHMTALGMGAA